MYFRSDEESADPPVVRSLRSDFSPRYAVSLSPSYAFAEPSIYSLAHAAFDGSHKGNSNVVAERRESANSRSIEKWVYYVARLSSCASDTLMYGIGSNGCRWNRSSTDRRRKFLPRRGRVHLPGTLKNLQETWSLKYVSLWWNCGLLQRQSFSYVVKPFPFTYIT